MSTKAKTTLAAPAKQPSGKLRKDGYYTKIAPKAISQARNDIATWKAAIKQASAVDNPRRIKLQNLYKDIALDALLTSQMENRRMKALASKFVLKDQGDKVNEEATAILRGSRWFYDILLNALNAHYYGPTLIELVNDLSGIRVVTIPRNNIEPVSGTLLYDENDSKGLSYREAKEFGTWLYEFGHPSEFGLLNKAIPHVLFKRFAQSCWSELCEIYGIPPRVMKTNTQDPAMLTRAEQMMRDMGAAAWFIIDETEQFDFAKGADTNGEVYDNLIRLCNNELSMLVSGAVIGQDTKNGNESKETVSVNILADLIDSDKEMVTSYMNQAVIKGLFQIGLIPDGLRFAYEPQENISQLWKRATEAMPYMEVDPAWVAEKFGIKVTGVKAAQPTGLSFFD